MAKKVVGAAIGLVILVGVYAFFEGMTNNRFSFGYNDGYEPTQPIPYDHAKHAGTYKIDCKYCHTTVEGSRHASVPSLNICMNCHIQVKTDSPHIQKLTEAYNSGKPVEWKKVHLLPDFVKFNHSAHMNASQLLSMDGEALVGNKRCTECHGKIEEMQVVQQHSTLSMGWCVNCHRQQEPEAPTDCGTCHY